MSQAGYTPIQLYYSTTAAATPSAGNLAAGELAVNITDGKLFYKDNGGVVRVLATAAGSAGDVVGPGSSTDNALVRFDGTTGKLVQSSVGILSDAGALSGLTSVAATTFTGALTGNASTATTLQTSRTIWGQSFDGSANVTGALTGVTDLTASGSLTLSGGTANGVTYLNGSKVLTTGSALWFDGTNFGVGTGGNALNHQSVVYKVGANAVYQQVANGSTGLGATNGIRLGVSNGGTGELYSPTALISYIDNSEQMRLTSTGLGIGTSSPATKLHVNAGASADTDVRLQAGASGNHAKHTYSDSANTVQWTSGYQSSTGYFRISAGNSFNTTGITLDPSGNLGLGVIPSASQIPQLQISRGTFTGDINSSYVSNNWYYNGGDKYIGTNYALQYKQEANTGVHKWFTAPSGTAGNAISFTQAMTLDASGNLLVGVTTDTNVPTTGVTLRNSSGTTGNIGIGHASGVTTGNPYLNFAYNGTGIGSVTQSGTTAVLYNVTSDQRLKENIADADSASSLIDSLQVRQYDWKADGNHQRYGFVAQELVTVAPEAVHQPADPEEMMAVDYSKLVPMLVKEIQSLRQRLAAAGI